MCADEGGGDVLYGCWDNEFVISEVNSNQHLWLKAKEGEEEYDAGMGYRLHLNKGFESDAWGDQYNTVGLQISTKKKGGISEECLREDELQDCSKELDDVTKYYKDKEDSGPGFPTLPGNRLKGDIVAEGDAFYKPDLSSEGHRMLAGVKHHRILDDAEAVSPITFSTIGVAPGSEGTPVVNLPGHFYSNVWVDLPFTNTGDAAEVVKCALHVETMDYSGRNSSSIKTATQSVTVEAGASASCEFETNRPEWKHHAAM
jgi:hypothetical protein